MKKKLLVFHQALAPYRVDLFNTLNTNFNLELYFIEKQVSNQAFDQETLKKQLNFTPFYLEKGLTLGTRKIRYGFYTLIKKFNPDIVFTVEYSLTTLFVYIIKKTFCYNFKIYTLCDDSVDIANKCRGIRKIARNLLFPRLDGVIVLNKEVADWYAKKYQINNKCIITPIIYEETSFKTHLTASLALANQLLINYNLMGKQCVFFVGRLAKVKGIDNLIKAFALLNTSNPNAVLVLVGDGNQLLHLKNLTAQLGITHKVLFVGRHEGAALYAWYNIGQVLVLNSFYEPFGAVVNEALLAGATVLCSTLAGSSAMVTPGVNGHLINPNNVPELAQLMQKTLLNTKPLQALQQIRPSKMSFCFQQTMSGLIHSISCAS
jgi:glycosyltransferase involved in cell wall biosynthesis